MSFAIIPILFLSAHFPKLDTLTNQTLISHKFSVTFSNSFHIF